MYFCVGSKLTLVKENVFTYEKYLHSKISCAKSVVLKGLQHLSVVVPPSGKSLLAYLAFDCSSKGSGS